MEKFDCRAFMASVRREAGERVAPASPRALLELLHLDGIDFLLAAYRTMLGREADPAGLRAYEARAASLPGRLRVLLSLLLSPERLNAPLPLQRFLTGLRERRARRGRDARQ